MEESSMNTLTADDNRLLKDVRLFVEPVKVYAEGKLLGLFVPANVERGQQLITESQARLDPAELKRRLEQEAGLPGATWPEIKQRLQAVDQEQQRRQAAGDTAFTPQEALAYYQSLKKET
jgi:hypothetical protein